MELHTVDDHVIELETRTGICRVELMQGDITQLSMEDSVDFIMVSAFCGDYAPMGGTVIGALKRNLGVNVLRMSEKKEMDLRHQFSCWVSGPIDTENCPYKKLICFERSRALSKSLVAQIRDLFRVFMPVFNNQDHSVITPLLAAGNQGSSEMLVLKTMTEAACEWIMAGLPLRVFKVVVYGIVNKTMSTTFLDIKQKYLAKSLKLKSQGLKAQLDIYLTFHEDDLDYVNSMKKKMLAIKADVKFSNQNQEYNEDAVWQDKIFYKMVTSKRILAFLSPSFMESSQCLDLYNMAMCCNRVRGFDVLAPLYIETVKDLPSYFGLVQWIDCRVRKEGDTKESKMKQGCEIILNSIENVPQPARETKPSAAPLESDNREKFDVFLSYSHKDPEKVTAMLEVFKTLDPKIKVFYDRSALTTGVNWQNMLYECVGECRCMIALISSSYLASTVCNEEFNLALGRHACKDKGMRLIPVLLEKIANVPDYISSLQPHNAATDFTSVTTEIAEQVVQWVNSTKEGEEAQDEPAMFESSYKSRNESVRQAYKLTSDKKLARVQPLDIPDQPDEKDGIVDIVISYAQDTTHLAGTFCTLIDQLCSDLDISVHTSTDLSRVQALDSAKIIVVFLSESFLKSQAHLHELHLSLNRQRTSKHDMLYLIKGTDFKSRPFFPRLLPYDVVCSDDVWNDFEIQLAKMTQTKPGDKRTVFNKFQPRLGHARTFYCHHSEFFAMQKAVLDVLEALLYKGTSVKGSVPLLLNVYDPSICGNSVPSGPTVTQHGEEPATIQPVKHNKPEVTVVAKTEAIVAHSESKSDAVLKKSEKPGKETDKKLDEEAKDIATNDSKLETDSKPVSQPVETDSKTVSKPVETDSKQVSQPVETDSKTVSKPVETDSKTTIGDKKENTDKPVANTDHTSKGNIEESNNTNTSLDKNSEQKQKETISKPSNQFNSSKSSKKSSSCALV